MSSSLTTGGEEPTWRTTAAREPDNFIKKSKTRHKAGAASAHVCFHRQPGNKSSRHMKADSVVSCDGAKGVSIFRFPRRYTARPGSPCVSALHKHTSKKKGKKKRMETRWCWIFSDACGSLLSQSCTGATETKALIESSALRGGVEAPGEP